ncbi:hypothetical protein [Streptomyces sp. YIM 98790]|nr:hypothetical protein [Streptomyces sp. YIM 98790]
MNPSPRSWALIVLVVGALLGLLLLAESCEGRDTPAPRGPGDRFDARV